MKLDAEQAVEVLKKCGRFALCEGFRPPYAEIKAALAALDGKHVYASRFKMGDRVWFYETDDCEPAGYELCEATIEEVQFLGGNEYYYHGPVWIDGIQVDECTLKESDCFPTRAEAEAAAEERNRKENER